MSENSYRLVVARMLDEDLISALTANESMYLDEMILAVLDECDKRKIVFPGAEKLRASISDRFVLEEQFKNEEVETVTIELPTLYSQTVILAFTIFFSPLFGGIMLAMNVHRVNKKMVWQVLVVTVLFTIASYFSYYLAPGSFAAILIPIAGALVFSELLWNRFIGRQIQYERRKITKPLIIALMITLPIAYYLYLHPELLQIANT